MTELQGRYVRSVRGADELPVELVGGKVRGVARLMRLGVNVPPGFCVTTDAIRDTVFAQSSGGCGRATGGGPSGAEAQAACASAPLPPGLEAEIGAGLDDLGLRSGRRVMVRSSAVLEDRTFARAPGVFVSLSCEPQVAAVVDAVRRVWASAFSADAERYVRRSGEEPGQLGLLIQVEVESMLAGAVYTLEPRSSDPSTIVVSWVPHNAARLMAGGEVGAAASFLKVPGGVAIDDTASEVQARPPHVAEVAKTAGRIERQLDEPLDLEFVIDDVGELHFVQCRPLPYSPRWKDSSLMTSRAHEETTLNSPKVAGVALNAIHGGDLIDQVVIRPPAFVEFRNAGALPGHVHRELSSVLRPLLERGDVSLRPAYWSALSSGDNLPQSGHLRSLDECFDALRALWQYVIQHNLDDYTAEVAVLAGNWLDTAASALVATQPGTHTIRIDSVPGFPEGLEDQPYQSAIVDLRSGLVIARERPRGNMVALSPHGGSLRVRQVSGDVATLTDDEYVRAAVLTSDIAHRFAGPVRVEFMVVISQDRRLLVVWQVERLANPATVAVYRISTTGSDQRIAAGTVVRVNSLRELSDRADRRVDDDSLLVLDLGGLRPRDREQQAAIAEESARLGCPVVVRTSPLSHVASILRDYGLAVYPVRELPPDLVSGVHAGVTLDVP
ncbi:PEP/pyruvate-binding domain-containing protein [Nostocoides australiense]